MLHCNQCEAEWEPRLKDGKLPVQCPRCKRVDWNQPPKKGQEAVKK